MDSLKEQPHVGSPVIEWACRGRALAESGQGAESGDTHVVAPFPEGVLVAAIDGLGHGAEAAVAACAAADVLQAYAGESVEALVQRCHESLRGTRGAVMSLASFSRVDSSMTWMGVGNVEAVLLRGAPTLELRNETLSLRGGIVGYQLPPLRTTKLPVWPGDTLIMATDGIRSGFHARIRSVQSPEEIAALILAVHSKDYDDALVVVARYLGDAS